jgi:hypothetical protein
MLNGMLNALQKRTKAAAFIGAVDIECAGKDARLVADHSHASSVDTPEPDHNVSRKLALNLQEIAAVHNTPDYVPDIVADFRIIGNDSI